MICEMTETRVCAHTHTPRAHESPRGMETHLAVALSAQHQRSHGDPAALRFDFHEVVTTGRQAPPDLLALQRTCLVPGWYAAHLERWLAHFAASQVRPGGNGRRL